MVAGLGSGVVHLPRRCDQRPIEAFAAVNACRLGGRGCLLPGAVSHWRLGDSVVSIEVEHATRILISIDGGEAVAVGVMRQGLFGQLLLSCPGCTRWRRNLYEIDGTLRCRCCPPALDYRVRHEARRGAARAVHLASKLRQRLNANPVPFSELPPRPRHHGSARVYDRLVAKLTVLESQAMAEFAAVVKMAERRAHGRKRR